MEIAQHAMEVVRPIVQATAQRLVRMNVRVAASATVEIIVLEVAKKNVQ